jgi:CheY-like chemotaxis protein
MRRGAGPAIAAECSLGCLAAWLPDPKPQGVVYPMPCVLVADDSTEFAEMLRATLEEAGFEVVTAYSGPAALAAMGSNEVDAAVLDVLMPGISGDAIADRLRRLYPELPIVLMTGDAGVPFVATADAPVLRKPFRHEELVDTIRGLL